MKVRARVDGLSVIEGDMLEHTSRPRSHGELMDKEDQVQQAWRRLAYAVRATRDHDAALAMRRFHDAVGELFGL